MGDGEGGGVRGKEEEGTGLFLFFIKGTKSSRVIAVACLIEN